jgi:hypothetical protein
MSEQQQKQIGYLSVCLANLDEFARRLAAHVALSFPHMESEIASLLSEWSSIKDEINKILTRSRCLGRRRAT